MRKIALILSLMMLLGITVASAEITRGEDTFTGAVTINSGVHEKESELKSLYFRKIPQSKNVDYEIEATRINFKEFIFKDTFMEIKVDDGLVQQFPVKEAKNMSLVRESDIYSSITVLLPNDMIPQINTAKRIALRFQTVAGPYVYVLPASVLAEWKQVIATEK
ncbi:hypothetical protein [Anaerospora hongkongensis]|uniref:hypothetical protein n=1 Tax=Anaerospora hongkongensis TaxID=244830 RepID=UPI00289FAC40|nr:hypothetical protein [Anaerospora hongkongensis]